MDNKFKKMLESLDIKLSDGMAEVLEYFHNGLEMFDAKEYQRELKKIASNKKLTIAAIKLGDINVTELPKNMQGDLSYSYAEIEAFHYGNKEFKGLLNGLPDVAFLNNNLVNSIKLELSNKVYSHFNSEKLKFNKDLVFIIESEIHKVEETIDQRVLSAKYNKEIKQIEDYFEQL